MTALHESPGNPDGPPNGLAGLDLSDDDKPLAWYLADDPFAPDHVVSCGEAGVPRIPCMLHESAIPYGELCQPARVFWFAFSHWIAFRHCARVHRIASVLRSLTAFPASRCLTAIDDLPWQDRPPLVFGALLLAAAQGHRVQDTPLGSWLEPQADREFPEVRRGETPLNEWARPYPPLPVALSLMERRILDSVARGETRLPEALPLCIEESPRRTWERAAGHHPNEARLITAALQSLDRFDYLRHFEPDPFGGDRDIGDVFDLITLAPRDHASLKTALLDEVGRRIKSGEVQWGWHQKHLIQEWVGSAAADREERPDSREAILRQLVTCSGSIPSKPLHRVELKRAGSLLYRLGDRQGAMECARRLGSRPSREFWHLQPLSVRHHDRVRQCAPRGQVAVGEEWTRCPALAASAMSLPLWLGDGVPRVQPLTELFLKAADYPWMFPKLYHVLQWHLALEANNEALGQISEICPQLSLGLSNAGVAEV